MVGHYPGTMYLGMMHTRVSGIVIDVFLESVRMGRGLISFIINFYMNFLFKYSLALFFRESFFSRSNLAISVEILVSQHSYYYHR
jgi:hypothetical protein